MSKPDVMIDRFRKLIDRLVEKTEAGEIAWLAANDEGCFQANFANFSVELEESSRLNEYYIRLYNEAGKVIESTKGSSLERNNWTPEYLPKLQKLFSSARRKALNVDKIFDDILERLS